MIRKGVIQILILISISIPLFAQVESNTTYIKFKVSKGKEGYVCKRYKKIKSNIQIHINEDATYTYQKILPSYKPKVISTKGKYEVKGDKIILHNFVVNEKKYLDGNENVYGVKKLFIVNGVLFERKFFRFLNKGGFVIPSQKNISVQN